MLSKPITLEERFSSFVRSLGGEVIADHLPRRTNLPKNADYFLFNRVVVAELKCLEKDYFRAVDVEAKLAALASKWLREGILRRDQISNDRFSTDSLPERCALEVLAVFAKPMREAVTAANKQLKATKEYFGVPNAKGLVIIANDGNYSLTPGLSMHVLGGLFKNRFSAIDSFVYFAPEMEVSIPTVAKSVRVWISGPTRDHSNGVPSELLARLSSGWVQFIERTSGDRVEIINPDNNAVVRDIEFTHREAS